MGTISVSLPSDATTADVADYNTPINTIVNEINGNLDNANIKTAAAIDGSKLADSSITSTKIVQNAVQADDLATNAITLGYAQIVANFNTGGVVTNQAVTGLSTTVTIPAGNRRIEIEVFTGHISVGAGTFLTLTVWDGTVGSGTQLAKCEAKPGAVDIPTAFTLKASPTPAAGSKTYAVGISSTAAAAQINAAATNPAYIHVKVA